MVFRLSFSFINPVSLYNSLKEVNYVPPDMILIASIWTSSKILIKYILWGFHTTFPYSNSGLIKDKYNFSNDDLSSLNFNRGSNWSDEDHIGWDIINFFKGIIQRNRINKTKR
jgi:hypothetical protein